MSEFLLEALVVRVSGCNGDTRWEVRMENTGVVG
jgi:hypothetical protein